LKIAISTSGSLNVWRAIQKPRLTGVSPAAVLGCNSVDKVSRARDARSNSLAFKDVRELANSDLFELQDAIQQLPGSASPGIGDSTLFGTHSFGLCDVGLP
jgi:hypothetical protein